MTEDQDQEESQNSKIEETMKVSEPPSLQDVREKINEQPGPIDFEIGTCPKPTFAWFKSLAEDRYADNYGLTLTMLKEKIEAYEHNEKRLRSLEKRISRLESDMDDLIEAIAAEEESGSSKKTLNETT